MSKSISYYDWQQSFKAKSKKAVSLNSSRETTLGIPNGEYKDFMENWKARNL